MTSFPLDLAGLSPDASRRDVLRLSIQGALLAVAGLAAGGWELSGSVGYDRMQFIRALFPATLGDVGEEALTQNADFVMRAFDRGLFGVTNAPLDALRDQLDGMFADSFVNGSPLSRRDLLAAIDFETFRSGNPIAHPWYPVKTMLLVSYFTSQHGMEHTLRYELAPGRYDPDVPAKGFVPVSNDWNAVRMRKPLVLS